VQAAAAGGVAGTVQWKTIKSARSYSTVGVFKFLCLANPEADYFQNLELFSL